MTRLGMIARARGCLDETRVQLRLVELICDDLFDAELDARLDLARLALLDAGERLERLAENLNGEEAHV